MMNSDSMRSSLAVFWFLILALNSTILFADNSTESNESRIPISETSEVHRFNVFLNRSLIAGAAVGLPVLTSLPIILTMNQPLQNEIDLLRLGIGLTSIGALPFSVAGSALIAFAWRPNLNSASFTSCGGFLRGLTGKE